MVHAKNALKNGALQEDVKMQSLYIYNSDTCLIQE